MVIFACVNGCSVASPIGLCTNRPFRSSSPTSSAVQTAVSRCGSHFPLVPKSSESFRAGWPKGRNCKCLKPVADVLVEVLEQIGVKHIFGLIGDSLNPLADAVRRSSIEWIGVRHEEGAALGRRTPTALGVVGSVAPTLKLLLETVATKSDAKFFDRVTNERKKWDEMLDKQADPARSKDVIHPQAVARAVGDLAARDAVFVFDTGLNTLWSANWIRQSGSQRIIGSFNNAAVGTALGQANGIQALDRSRQVIALCGDGGFNMLMCEFLTAVHHKLPVKVIVY